MCAHIDWHGVDQRGKIGSVIQIKTPKVVLIRLARPAVLTGNQPGHSFQHFAGSQQRAYRQFILRHNPLGRC